MDVPQKGALHKEGREVDMLGEVKHALVYFVESHHVHGALVREVCAVLSVIHTDGCAGGSVSGADEMGGYALCFK